MTPPPQGPQGLPNAPPADPGRAQDIAFRWWDPVMTYIYEGDGSANSAPPKNVENIEIVKTASRPVWHPRGCIGASNGASTALKLPGKPEIHVFFVRLYTYAGP